MTSRPLPALHMPSDPTPSDAARDFEVRSITGASYTIVEEIAHDGTFTIVDTGTRLVRVDAPPS